MSTKMTDVYRIELLPGADEEAFLQYARDEEFPRISLTRAAMIDKHILLKQHDEEQESRQYLWIVHWTLHFGIEVLHAIPPSLRIDWQQPDGLVEVISFERFIQVTEHISHEDA